MFIKTTPISVTYRDGRTETIELGELSIRQLYTFIRLLGGNDTPALVALCASRPVEWVDTLTDESFDALVKAAVQLNFQRAADRAKNDPVALSKMGPLLLELDAVVAAMPGLRPNGETGKTPSPEPASSGSAAATPIASSISLPPA